MLLIGILKSFTVKKAHCPLSLFIHDCSSSILASLAVVNKCFNYLCRSSKSQSAFLVLSFFGLADFVFQLESFSSIFSLFLDLFRREDNNEEEVCLDCEPNGKDRYSATIKIIED
jgi:hypothetical protein